MATLRYWLVGHPFIADYEWRPHHSPGASPRFVAAAVATYLTLTVALRRLPILPVVPPAALKIVTIAHSLLLCLISLVMAVGCALSAVHQTPPHRQIWPVCFPPGRTPPRGPTFFWAHVFYFSKILEFGDTLLILFGEAGRPRRRLSFLHVYHHAAVVVMCYLWLTAPQSLFPVALVTNAAVHVAMYAYYAAAAAGIRWAWRWKRAVTDLQIAQFVFSFGMSGWMLREHFYGSGCEGIRAWCFNAVFNASLLALFLNFHFRNYHSKIKSSQSKGNKVM